MRENGMGDGLEAGQWTELRAEAHRMLDDMLDHLEHRRAIAALAAGAGRVRGPPSMRPFRGARRRSDRRP